MDIIWLQRDLGLYIVGLFDTFHAASALHYPKRSLAWLLSKFANFEAQKAYQMADWRIRPLPKEFLEYARSDTHFLLYVYDRMRNDLIQHSDRSQQGGDLIKQVEGQSKKECLQKFERPIYDEEHGTGAFGWYNMLIKTPAPFDKYQFAVFRAIHRWRDDLARKEDESLFSIMQNNVLLSIARQMPTTVTDLMGSVSPVSDAMRKQAQELVRVIKDAKTAGEDGPDMKDALRTHPSNIAYEARKAERAAAKKPPGHQTLAEIVQQEKAKQQVREVQLGSVLGKESNFWGPTVSVDTTKGDNVPSKETQSSELRLQVPLPPLTAAVYSSAANGAVPSAPATRMPEHEFTKKEKRSVGEEVVVVRDMGRKYKRKAESLEADDSALEAATGDGIDGSEVAAPTEDDAHGVKAERKAARKAEKARKKEEQARAKEQEKSEAAFDYASAPSVLNHKPGKADKAKSKAKSKPTFNPYAKSADAPKGMKKAKKEIQGKTTTFKK
jgi:exosome complex exonuclease RRP6